MTRSLADARAPGQPMPGRLLACVLVLAALAGCATERTPGAGRASPSAPYRDPHALRPGEIMHAATGRLLTAPQLLDHLARARVVYVGESHDSAGDHRVQLAILEGLHARAGGRLALGVEMLRQPYQAAADGFIRGEIDEAAFRRAWLESWGEWDLYADLLRFARERSIPVVALGADPRLTDAVRRDGEAGPPPGLAGRLPDMDLDDPHHRAYVRAAFDGHGGGTRDFERFYRVQVFWDETMAEAAARFLDGRQDRVQLLVLAGSGHVRFGFGIPRRLFRRLPAPYATLLPVHVEVAEAKRDRRMDLSPPALPLPAGDFYWAVRYE